MMGRRWQVVCAAVAAAMVIGALWVSRRGGRPVPGGGGPPRERAQPKWAAPRPSGPQGRRLEGRVVGPQGVAAPGAEVVLVPVANGAPSPAGAHPDLRAVGDLGVYTGPLPLAKVAARMPSLGTWVLADGAGRFAFDPAPAGRSVLYAHQVELGDGRVELPAEPATRSVEILLQKAAPVVPPVGPAVGGPEPSSPGHAPTTAADAPPPADPPIPVRVRDAQTRATIVGAKVSFSDGRVHVRAARYAPVDVSLPSDARELEVDLDLAADISGRLLDARGDPAVGATVEGGGAKARSDARGEFRLTGVRPGFLVLEAHTPSGERGRAELTLLPGERRQSVDLRLADEPPAP